MPSEIVARSAQLSDIFEISFDLQSNFLCVAKMDRIRAATDAVNLVLYVRDMN